MPKVLGIMKMDSHLTSKWMKPILTARRRIFILQRLWINKEFLYARAIQEITGQNPAPTTRSAETLMRGKALKVPAIYRPGHEGMIKLPK